MLRLLLIYLLLLFGYNEAGVYPNYRASFDFISYDKDFNVDQVAADSKWWETGSFYQIYPRSFKDSDGDGVGDLKGIMEQLPYLKEIGITATWLSPIFKSPMADFGYDIANFTEIDPIFGNLDDLTNLIKAAKKLGIKIILDFVPNHTSDECEWFIKSAAKDPYYKDFYVWHPGKLVNGVLYPPANWVSVFRGPAWTWHEGRKEYYLHQFLKKQPDLNYRNPKVRETMKDVLRYWLKKGVSGFRIDAVPHVFEIAADVNGNWPDEPRNDWVHDPDDYGYLKHIYTVDQPETIDMVYEWRKVLDDYQKETGGLENVLLAESYSPLDIEMKYYGNATVNGAQIPFNFLLLSWVSNDSDAYHYAETINTWLNSMPAGRIANWVIGNHDKSRVGSRLGADRIDMMNILIKTLPGVSVTYQGEEIGMTNVWISWNDTVDPSACNSNPNIYETFTRDPERTPFQWDDSKDAGFSSANKTWLPLSDTYKLVNVKKERNQLLSHLSIYKQLQLLRNETTLKYGTASVKAINKAVIGVERSLLHDYTFVTLMNIFDNVENINLHTAFGDLPYELQYVLVTDKSSAKLGDKVLSSSVRLNPKEAVVLRSTTKLTTTVGYFTYYQSYDSQPDHIQN